jgi:hypothetical protein
VVSTTRPDGDDASPHPAEPVPGDLAAGEVAAGEVRDELPADLDRGFVGPYTFPDNKRRRIPGTIYVVAGVLAVLLVVWRGGDAVLVNTGLAAGGVGLVLIGLYHLLAGYPLDVDENDALLAATRALGFPVGHASAQLSWRGLRSRPTWRVLVYSAENPPLQRALVLVDGVDGHVVDQLVEKNPEDWDEPVT